MFILRVMGMGFFLWKWEQICSRRRRVLFMELSRSVTCAGCFQRSEMWLFKINVQLLKQKGKKIPLFYRQMYSRSFNTYLSCFSLNFPLSHRAECCGSYLICCCWSNSCRLHCDMIMFLACCIIPALANCLSTATSCNHNTDMLSPLSWSCYQKGYVSGHQAHTEKQGGRCVSWKMWPTNCVHWFFFSPQ